MGLAGTYPSCRAPVARFCWGEWGGGKKSPRVCVSSMRSDTWWRLPVLPGFAREGGARGSQPEPGGGGAEGVVGGRTRGEVICYFASRSFSCGSRGRGLASPSGP